MDTNIQPILEKSLAGERLDFDDCLTLFKSHDLLALGHAADAVSYTHLTLPTKRIV